MSPAKTETGSAPWTVIVFNTGATDPELAGRLNDAVWGDEAIAAYREYLGRVGEAP